MKQKELKKILENHERWLNDRGGMRADLHEVDLSKADLRKADLSGADMCEANLYRSDLREADLRKADLSGANLSKADLRKADLSGADLSGADLSGALMWEANLHEVDLSKADLYGADLRKADLSGVYLRETNLYGADLYGANNIPFIPSTCPEFGAFIGFKKADGKIVMLEIPEDAKRLSATGRKCRCNKAKVLEIQNLDGTKATEIKVTSDYDNNFIYEIGETVSVSDFCEDRWEECSDGIHFFINRQEAVEY